MLRLALICTKVDGILLAMSLDRQLPSFDVCLNLLPDLLCHIGICWWCSADVPAVMEVRLLPV